MHLDHITLRTRNLPGTRDFFVELFELEEKPRPKEIQHIPGHWLYAGDRPIIHLIGSYGSHGNGQDRAAEAFDHVGLHLEDYTGFRSRLDHMGITYSLMEVPELDERRLFFRTPGGPLLEAVFHEPKI